VDVDPDTLLLDPKRVEEAVVPGKTRAIMPVHLFGQPADMTALRSIASKYNLRIIEDAAQAHGAEWETGPVGSLGDAAGFSFQSFKNLSCGEGGALTTNDEEVFERAYSIHNVGRSRIGGGRWEHHTLGWNCRPTEYQAALLLHRFRTFEREQAKRQTNFFRLRQLLSENGSCLEPLTISCGVRRHGMHMFVVRYHADRCGGNSFQAFLAAAQSEGLPINQAYQKTISNQPAMQKLMDRHREYFRILPTPVADKAIEEIAYIAQNIFLGTEKDMLEIIQGVKKVQNHFESRPVSLATTMPASAYIAQLTRK
jgi:dTDP-4-amino-4,6-dideoxygalactose transaminase